MFYCPEIDTDTAYTRWAKWGLTVAYKTGDYLTDTIDASIADGNYSGKWERLKRTMNNESGTSPAWYVSDVAALQYGTFAVNSTVSKTITELASVITIDIDNQTGITDGLYWQVSDLLKLYSDYFFIVYTPAGLTFAKPMAWGTDRGIVYNEDVIFKTTFDKTFNYTGESTGDIFISSLGDVQPSIITSAYKQLAVNKMKASANTVVFTSGTLCKPGDYMRTADGVKYVILHGETIGTGKYRYTAVLEVTDSLTFTASDAIVNTDIQYQSPTGVMNEFAGSTAPAGWLLCYGQAISRADFADLYSVIGTTYGTGDGSTTFNVPDMRGVFPRGLDSMGGTAKGYDSGRALGTYQADANKSHRHYETYGPTLQVNSAGGVLVGSGTVKVHYNDPGTRYTDYDGSTETRPKNIALNYIIKY